MRFLILDQLIERFRAFRADEDGGATADFVVLTASIMMMGAAHAKDVADGTLDISDDLQNCLGSDISTQLFDGGTEDTRTYVEKLEAAGAWCSDGIH